MVKYYYLVRSFSRIGQRRSNSSNTAWFYFFFLIYIKEIQTNGRKIFTSDLCSHCKICSSQPEEQISKRGAETESSVTPCVKNRHISQSEIAEHVGDDSEPLVVRGKDKDHETQECMTIESVCTSKIYMTSEFELDYNYNSNTDCLIFNLRLLIT